MASKPNPSAAQRGQRAVNRGALRSPSGQGVEIDAGRHVAAQQSQILTQIEKRTQFGDGGLTRADLLRRRRMQQPRSQRVLAGARARRAEQLEQGTRAEQIEIARIRVSIVVEARTVLAAPPPVVAQTRQTIFVKGDGPQRSVPSASDSFVVKQQNRVQQNGRQQPPSRQPMRAEGEQEQQHFNEEDEYARIAGEAFLPSKLESTRAALLQTPRVFFRRRRGGGFGRWRRHGLHNFSRSMTAADNSFRTPYCKRAETAAPVIKSC